MICMLSHDNKDAEVTAAPLDLVMKFHFPQQSLVDRVLGAQDPFITPLSRVT